MDKPTMPTTRRTDTRKEMPCVRRSLRSSMYVAAGVALWSMAHGVGAQDSPMVLGPTIDDAANIQPLVGNTRLQEDKPEETLAMDGLDDYGVLPEPADASETPTKESSTEFPPTTTLPPSSEPTQTIAEKPTTPTQTTEAPTNAMLPNTNNAISNSASNLRGPANSVNPALLIGFAVLCTAFLALWIRRRRSGADGGGEESGGSSMSGMTTTSSTEKREDGGKKAQYSRLDAQTEEEQLLEDEFGGRSGSWDDWDNHQGQKRIDIHPDDDEEEHRGTARLTKGHSSSSLVTPQSPPLAKSSSSVRTVGVKLASPPLSTGRGGGGHLHDGATSPPPRPTSVGSNSSNESFEVVVSPPAAASIQSIDLLSGSLSHTPVHHTESETSSPPEDDLFSQFGMVPTFKKGVQQAPVVVSPSPPPSFGSSYTSPSSTALNPFAASPPQSSATATSLFAADMDDMDLSGDAAIGANEWGDEEDDWVQGL